MFKKFFIWSLFIGIPHFASSCLVCDEYIDDVLSQIQKGLDFKQELIAFIDTLNEHEHENVFTNSSQNLQKISEFQRQAEAFELIMNLLDIRLHIYENDQRIGNFSVLTRQTAIMNDKMTTLSTKKKGIEKLIASSQVEALFNV
ncbi:MAG TPA: hypothetical protein VLG50_04680 [Candidatus Saccharimonadales bacterium]|nr:hypothetical protein [Candidatus Saccharimonadales bacterium]